MSTSSNALQLEPAVRATFAPALELVFGHLDPVDRRPLLDNLLAADVANLAPIEGLWTARRGSELRGAVWAQVQPGATAVVWPPGLVAGEPESTAAELLQVALAELAARKVRLAQALLQGQMQRSAERLRAVGFRQFAELMYLVSFDHSFPLAPPGGGLEFETYSEQNHERMVAAIERSYEASHDCPSLNGVRKMEDVLAGYRATGDYSPARWFIVREALRDVGCLLLTDHPGVGHWELVYMGIVPSARGRSIGLNVVRFAQWHTRLAGRSRLVLAVDAENRPAREMYGRAGFTPWEQRSVMMRILDENA